MFVNKLFTYHILPTCISKSKRYFSLKSSTYYFHMHMEDKDYMKSEDKKMQDIAWQIFKSAH